MSAWCKRDENKAFSLKDCCGGECPCPSGRVPSLRKWVNGSHWGGWISRRPLPSLQEREGIEGGGARAQSGGGGNKGEGETEKAGGEEEMGKRGEAIDAIKPTPFCHVLC